MAAAWREEFIDLGGLKLRIGRGGSGRPVLVLHHDIGTLDKLPFYEALSARFDVIVPNHPGFGESPSGRNGCATARYRLALSMAAGRARVERPSLVGLGFGGWIAAEMAALAPRDFHRLVLVGAMGVKPPEGDIFDQAIVSYIDYAKAGFHDQEAFAEIYGDVTTDQLVDWDLCREMSFRIAWKPYMYSQTLPHLLGGVKAPALVVWGDHDRIVPRSAGELYAKSLRNAGFEIVAGAGHCVDMEQPDELARLVTSFVEEN